VWPHRKTIPRKKSGFTPTVLCGLLDGPMANDIVLSLAAKPGNPRNSEGSFVNLANGDILFAYSRYTGSWRRRHRRPLFP
jgi:hypothetical protein